MLRCKSVDTPIELNHKLSKADKDAIIDQERYQRLDSKLIYPLHTWLDIDNAISVASQFMYKLKETNLQAVYRILHYLKSTTGKGILFKKNAELSLKAYTDADQAGYVVDRKSTSGYWTLLG